MNIIDNCLAAVAGTVVAIIVTFFVYGIFVWTPVNLYAEAKCLRAGYPVAKVSVGLEIYCVTLDGTVTIKVDQLP